MDGELLGEVVGLDDSLEDFWTLASGCRGCDTQLLVPLLAPCCQVLLWNALHAVDLDVEAVPAGKRVFESAKQVGTNIYRSRCEGSVWLNF